MNHHRSFVALHGAACRRCNHNITAPAAHATTRQALARVQICMLYVLWYYTVTGGNQSRGQHSTSRPLRLKHHRPHPQSKTL